MRRPRRPHLEPDEPDVDDVLEEAGGGLVEIARGARRVFLWGEGRLWASMNGRGVRLRRRLGVVGPGIRLTWAELEAVARLARTWSRLRDGWHAFYFSCAGYPGGFGGATYRLAPGRRSRAERIGVETVYGRSGGRLAGRDEERPTRRRGWAAEIWRVGEPRTPKGGVLTGLVARLPGGLEARLERMSLDLRRGEEEVEIEPGEEGMLGALRGRGGGTPGKPGYRGR